MKPTALFLRLIQSRHPLLRIVQWPLYLISLVYGSVVRLRGWGFAHHILHQKRLPAPVICIGNITVGGTGKTPAVVWLVRKLRQFAVTAQPVILSRGYGQDEALLLGQLLPDTPHFVNPDRFRGGQMALQRLGKPLIFVLDDGFQHRRLYRNLDIVLVDAMQPFGYGHLLPRGLLREPPEALRRAQFVMLTKCDLVSSATLQTLVTHITGLAPQAKLLKSIHKPTAIRELSKKGQMGLEVVQGQKCLLVTGIGNPQNFYCTAQRLGADVVGQCQFSDHHQYTAADMLFLKNMAQQAGAQAILTTAKDAVKLASLIGATRSVWPGLPIWVVDIELSVYEGEQQLQDAVKRLSLILSK